MAAKSKSRRFSPASGVGFDDPMTPEQAAELKQLAFAAYEPEAFSCQLTQANATQRIVTLRAKLKLMDEPPHTL